MAYAWGVMCHPHYSHAVVGGSSPALLLPVARNRSRLGRTPTTLEINPADYLLEITNSDFEVLTGPLDLGINITTVNLDFHDILWFLFCLNPSLRI